MTKTMRFLISLFAVVLTAAFLASSLTARPVRADEIDEEVKSTIASDPDHKASKPAKATPAPKKPEPLPVAKPKKAKSVKSSGGDSEDSEWATMHSEKTNSRVSSAASSSASAPKTTAVKTVAVPVAFGASMIDRTNKRLNVRKINFNSNSDAPTEGSVATLKNLAKVLQANPDLASIRIEGHTDTIGYDQPNLELSQKRADKVKEILVANGVDAGRLTAVGMGDKKPVAGSTTAEGQEKNRRVEFHIASMTEAKPAAATPATVPVPKAAATPPAPASPATPAPVAATPPKPTTTTIATTTVTTPSPQTPGVFPSQAPASVPPTVTTPPTPAPQTQPTTQPTAAPAPKPSPFAPTPAPTPAPVPAAPAVTPTPAPTAPAVPPSTTSPSPSPFHH